MLSHWQHTESQPSDMQDVEVSKYKHLLCRSRDGLTYAFACSQALPSIYFETLVATEDKLMRLHVVKPCPQFTLKPWLQQRTNLCVCM